MKIIKYKLMCSELVLLDKEIRCPDDCLAANLEIAKKEAYNGEYEIVEETEAVQIEETNI